MTAHPHPPVEPPLAAELRRHRAGERVSFHMPGHKGGAGASPLARRLLGDAAIAADVSEMGGFDYLYAPEAGIVEAQRAAATLFGAGNTYFLVNGSTGGNLAALMAVLGDGDGVVMSRGSHRSVFAGTVLAGAVPRYVPLRHDTDLDGWFVGDEDALDACMADAPGRPPVRAIHVTRPNYYGMCCDLRPYVAHARRLGIPLIVDEAHGSHLGLHPGLPPSALAEGADIVVQSTHKTLGSLTQSSMLHVREGAPIDLDTLTRTLQMLQSSSPSVLLTLSLDLARDHLEREGGRRLGQAIVLADEVRDAAHALGLRPYRGAASPGVSAYDPTKVVIDVTPLGLTGFEASAYLRGEHGLWVELADFRRIVCSVTVGDTSVSVMQLTRALQALRDAAFDAADGVEVVGEGVADGEHTGTDAFAGAERPASLRLTAGGLPRLAMPPVPEMVETPRAATQRPADSVPVDAAAGRISAEYVIPYPPGIPLVVPGERVDAAVLAALGAFRDGGSRIVGPADPTGKSLRVLEER